MRAIKGSAAWLAALLVPLLAGCASTHYVEIYVDMFGASCGCSADMGQDEIGTIFTFPGDVLVWVNNTGAEIEIKPKLPGLFKEVTYVVPADGRAIIPVLGSANGPFPVDLSCDSGGVAGPSVVVGDRP